jgi:hypothetical protein
VTTAIAEEAAACGLDVAGSEAPEPGALGLTEAVATDDNWDAAVVMAFRDRHR